MGSVVTRGIGVEKTPFSLQRGKQLASNVGGEHRELRKTNPCLGTETDRALEHAFIVGVIAEDEATRGKDTLFSKLSKCGGD